MRYDRENDNISELINDARRNDKDAFKHIAALYDDMLSGIVNAYAFSPEDRDDLRQEALIGLYRAVMTYNENYSAFSTFAHICMKRAVISYLRKSNSKGCVPKNKVSSLNDEVGVNAASDPESDLIDKESLEIFLKKTDSVLSPFEKKVLGLYLSDASYLEISTILGRPRKSIDNAIQRMRRKLKLLID